jgi:hypothetical protein
MSRYIDDGLTVNGIEVLMKYIEEIYPGMIVKKENKQDHKTHFLDLNLVINFGQIKLSTYDKRDDFPFEVRSFPNLEGNVHFTRSHGVIIGQLRRFALACEHYPHFLERLQTLTTRLQEQHFSKKILEQKVRSFFDENEELVKGYKVDEDGFVQGCFKEKTKKQKSRGKKEKQKARKLVK